MIIVNFYSRKHGTVSGCFDEKDYFLLETYNWSAQRAGNTFYLMSTTKIKGKRRQFHRVKLGLINSELQVDHANGNGLDNRRSNLRLCKKLENSRNTKIRTDNTSGYKGVTFKKANNKFRAFIYTNYKQIHLGYFSTAKEAALAYNQKALELFGEFAKLNIIKD